MTLRRIENALQSYDGGLKADIFTTSVFGPQMTGSKRHVESSPTDARCGT